MKSQDIQINNIVKKPGITINKLDTYPKTLNSNYINTTIHNSIHKSIRDTDNNIYKLSVINEHANEKAHVHLIIQKPLLDITEPFTPPNTPTSFNSYVSPISPVSPVSPVHPPIPPIPPRMHTGICLLTPPTHYIEQHMNRCLHSLENIITHAFDFIELVIDDIFNVTTSSKNTK
tara:strand:+ start:547 stop:1071 length:525 start_codon:yes stop_codon:yes gene_type:complete